MMQLETQDLSIALSGRSVLQNIRFSARGGEFICILGPNGAGKSTLLRALAGLLPCQRVFVDGQCLADFSAKARAKTISWLPQTGQAAWPLSVYAVVALGRIPHGASLDRLTAQDESAVDAALQACDLVHLATRDVTRLSGGERARVLLARTLAVEAPIVLADEPVSALDPHHQLSVIETLRLQAHHGRLVIAVLHDLSLAARFADRTLLLHEGRLIADGAPESVLTDQNLAHVFGIDAIRVEQDGVRLVLPWSAHQR